MKNKVNDKEVTAHLFEYTTSFALDPNLHFKYPDKGIVPTQIIFCMKEKNQKKINSHRWFFNAFGPMLQVSEEVTGKVQRTQLIISPTSVCCLMSERAHPTIAYIGCGKRLMLIQTSAARVVRSQCTRARIGSIC